MKPFQRVRCANPSVRILSVLTFSLLSGMWTSLALGLSSKIMEPKGFVVGCPQPSKSGSRADSARSLPAPPAPGADLDEKHILPGWPWS